MLARRSSREVSAPERRRDQTRPRVRDLADAHRANSHRQRKGAGDGHASAGSSGPAGHHRTGSAENTQGSTAAAAGSSGGRIGAGPAPQSGRDVRARDARARRRRAPSRRAARAARPALLRVPPRWRPASAGRHAGRLHQAQPVLRADRRSARVGAAHYRRGALAASAAADPAAVYPQADRGLRGPDGRGGRGSRAAVGICGTRRCRRRCARGNGPPDPAGGRAVDLR